MCVVAGLIIVGGLFVAAGYNHSYSNTFSSFIFNICQKAMYVCTVIEYHISNLMNKYSEYKSTYLEPLRSKYNENMTNSENKLLYIKNNNILENINDGDNDFDLILLQKEGSMIVDKKIESLMDRSKSIDNTTSNVSFIMFDVTFKKNMDFQETFSIDMKKGTNYIKIGNKIDKFMVWYLVKDQFKRCFFGQSYTLQVIDKNVNMFTLSEDNSLTILEDSLISE